jgi:hypothetical protein
MISERPMQHALQRAFCCYSADMWAYESDVHKMPFAVLTERSTLEL